MGLGPPVCEDCMLIMSLNNSTHAWSCPKCGNLATYDGYTRSLWEFPSDVQQVIEQNSKLHKQ